MTEFYITFDEKHAHCFGLVLSYLGERVPVVFSHTVGTPRFD